MLAMVARTRELVEGELRQLEVYWPRPAKDAATASVCAQDDVRGAVRRLVAKVKSSLGSIDAWAKRLVGISVQANRENVDERLAREIKSAIGVDVHGILAANGPLLQSMRKATDENVALIKTVPEQYLERVENTVATGFAEGHRWETLVDRIKEDGDITERRAKVIARDQTAKMNSAFNRERQQQVGIEKYIWSTSKDERVRQSHVEVDGKTFRWDEPGPVAGSVDGAPCHAGEDINCRCVAVPLVDMEELELAVAQAEETAA